MSTRTISENTGSAHEDSTSLRSILFLDPAVADIGELQEPEYFHDLNLDQLVDAMTAGYEEYNLKPFFYLPLHSVDAVNYRYEVLRDVEQPQLASCIRSFAQAMQRMRQYRAQEEKAYYKRQKQRWLLDAVALYCDAVRQLGNDLADTASSSRALHSFRDFLSSYIKSVEFLDMAAATQAINDRLGGIVYALHISGKQIAVSRYEGDPDYGADVLRTFEKFSQAASKEYHFGVRPSPDMNHVEAAILDLVARIYPEVFSSLAEYTVRYANYLDRTIAMFDREVQFYLACLRHITRYEENGLTFCYPVVSEASKEVSGRNVFDPVLANKLLQEHASVIVNDFYLCDSERILVVSGPNQGGKTTFARTVGQLHYLASIGCPVPGSEARLFLCDRIFTHFEKEEHVRDLSGKLEDELLRIRTILEHATSNSILVMNESFLSTTLGDAIFLSRKIMQRIIDMDMLCVSVTFLDEMALLSAATVSMVSTVNAKDPALRTFKIVRRPADGLAYAAAIAEKYRLTYDAVRVRIARAREKGARP